ncbi:MAG: hypothetical protein AAGK37_08095 [Pseudomonadota bacterium]
MSDKVTTHGLDAAFDCMKHITTLCTGVIALTVTFAKEFKPAGTDLTVPFELKTAWAFLVLSLLFSLWSLLAVTGSLNAVDRDPSQNDAMSSNVRIPSFLAILSFLVGIALTVYAALSIAG